MLLICRIAGLLDQSITKALDSCIIGFLCELKVRSRFGQSFVKDEPKVVACLMMLFSRDFFKQMQKILEKFGTQFGVAHLSR